MFTGGVHWKLEESLGVSDVFTQLNCIYRRTHIRQIHETVYSCPMIVHIDNSRLLLSRLARRSCRTKTRSASNRSTSTIRSGTRKRPRRTPTYVTHSDALPARPHTSHRLTLMGACDTMPIVFGVKSQCWWLHILCARVYAQLTSIHPCVQSCDGILLAGFFSWNCLTWKRWFARSSIRSVRKSGYIICNRPRKMIHNTRYRLCVLNWSFCTYVINSVLYQACTNYSFLHCLISSVLYCRNVMRRFTLSTTCQRRRWSRCWRSTISWFSTKREDCPKNRLCKNCYI